MIVNNHTLNNPPKKGYNPLSIFNQRGVILVKIRLKRFGKKKQPFYRVVAAHSPNARDGKTLETLGTYDPTKDPILLDLKKDRIAYWISVGAQPSDTVARLFGNEGLIPKRTTTSSHAGVSKKQRKEQAA